MGKTFVTFGGSKPLISGAAAVVELEKQTLDYAGGTADTDDVLVFLEPQNIPILEIRCTEADVVFIREFESAGESRNIHVLHGEPFGASIDTRPRKGAQRLITKFEYAC